MTWQPGEWHPLFQTGDRLVHKRVPELNAVVIAVCFLKEEMGYRVQFEPITPDSLVQFFEFEIAHEIYTRRVEPRRRALEL